MSKIAKLLLIALFAGLISGALSSAFLYLLQTVTHLRNSFPHLIFGLPIFGLIFGLIIKRIPHHINQGVPYILEELVNHQAKVSVWMTPFIFISSLGTHLFGGSAGREGVGVIMGASATHLLPMFVPSIKEMRTFLIYSGIASGFSAIFGTPFAAIIFAFELHAFKHINKMDLLICSSLAAFTALTTSYLLGTTHQLFNVSITIDSSLISYIVIATLTSGIGANIFYWGLKGYTQLVSYWFSKIELKLLFGSLFIVFIVFATNSYPYVGIGTEMIVKSFVSEMTPFDFMMKCLLTIMTLSIGLKGGEVTPLFFMGATFSNSICSLFNLRNFALSSSLGLVGLFGAVTNTPVASTVIAFELFGWKVGLLAFAVCWVAKLMMGQRSIYRH